MLHIISVAHDRQCAVTSRQWSTFPIIPCRSEKCRNKSSLQWTHLIFIITVRNLFIKSLSCSKQLFNLPSSHSHPYFLHLSRYRTDNSISKQGMVREALGGHVSIVLVFTRYHLYPVSNIRNFTPCSLRLGFNIDWKKIIGSVWLIRDGFCSMTGPAGSKNCWRTCRNAREWLSSSGGDGSRSRYESTGYRRNAIAGRCYRCILFPKTPNRSWFPEFQAR